MSVRRTAMRIGMWSAVCATGWAGAAEPAPAVSQTAPAARTAPISFRKTVLDDKFRSEGVAVADFNRDGSRDIATGSVYYAAPDWKMHLIAEKAAEFDPSGYSNTFTNFADDLNGDGWDDLIVVDWPGKQTWWHANPQQAGGPWKRHEMTPITNNESPQYVGLLGNGERQLVCGLGGDRMGFVSRGKDVTALWDIRPVAETNRPVVQRYYHGLGIGDLDKDGRNDIVCPDGWWKGTTDGSVPWKWTPVKFCDAAGHMYVYDVDGDNDQDMLASSAHKYGIWWIEQTPDGWKKHEIDTSYSQTHALVLADLDGDGLQDLVSGKRWWAHGAKGDPGSDQPAVLYWHRLTRTDGKPTWTPHLIDNQSGIGVQFEVTDVNSDSKLDIVVANKRGAFLFEQVKP